MAGFSSSSLLIPRVVDLGRTPWGHFAVSERAWGVPLDELDAEGMKAALPALLNALDALGTIVVGCSVGYGLWGPDRIAPHGSWRAALLDVGSDRRVAAHTDGGRRWHSRPWARGRSTRLSNTL